ncbi:ferredoxin nadp+ oxidoreductase fnr [Cystoisospora suis]|uniref:ferredoxin--NADP(+) reductase n=1 Tax=Cystoisospora suis TaxID=483139 RepID=A0A2C6L2H4_9APIC|nr:ferredoxin nadp+ oxidoreductase fnr [Cystoisospora suis]
MSCSIDRSVVRGGAGRAMPIAMLCISFLVASENRSGESVPAALAFVLTSSSSVLEASTKTDGRRTFAGGARLRAQLPLIARTASQEPANECHGRWLRRSNGIWNAGRREAWNQGASNNFISTCLLYSTPGHTEASPVYSEGDAMSAANDQPSAGQRQAVSESSTFQSLEHLDSDVPINTFRPSAPLLCRVVSVLPATGEGRAEPRHRADTDAYIPEIYTVVLHHACRLRFVEGQSIAIRPKPSGRARPFFTGQIASPEADASRLPTAAEDRRGVPMAARRRDSPRIYSIASSRYGDDGTGSTLTLCVKKHVYTDPLTGERDPSKDGVCSTFICNAKPGDEFEVTGPMGKTLLLPKQEDAPLVMLATGTGVAPFRGHIQSRRLRRMAAGHTSTRQPRILLFVGARTAEAVPYLNEWKACSSDESSGVELHLALSRQMHREDGKRLYIQDLVWRERAKVWKALQEDGGHLYVCGLKSMLSGVEDVLARVARECAGSGMDFVRQLKQERRWHVEVY